MAKIIRTDGSEEELKDTSLQSLQTAVGGNIEMTFTNDGKVMWINEEGKLKGLMYNEKATKLYVHKDRDDILGDVVVGDEAEFAGDDES